MQKNTHTHTKKHKQKTNKKQANRLSKSVTCILFSNVSINQILTLWVWDPEFKNYPTSWKSITFHLTLVVQGPNFQSMLSIVSKTGRNINLYSVVTTEQASTKNVIPTACMHVTMCTHVYHTHTHKETQTHNTDWSKLPLVASHKSLVSGDNFPKSNTF